MDTSPLPEFPNLQIFFTPQPRGRVPCGKCPRGEFTPSLVDQGAGADNSLVDNRGDNYQPRGAWGTTGAGADNSLVDNRGDNYQPRGGWGTTGAGADNLL